MHEEIIQVAKNRCGESEEGTILYSTQNQPGTQKFLYCMTLSAAGQDIGKIHGSCPCAGSWKIICITSGDSKDIDK